MERKVIIDMQTLHLMADSVFTDFHCSYWSSQPPPAVVYFFQDSILFRSARTSCTTFGWFVRPALKIWITYIQAYMPYEL